ncbi:glycosyltransferase [Desulfothermobacter acidiphilus]|uniref:glycosyltransferase n=1 Tax=Desulfothermobacter acidiphilus TaxID=1938353 RepID=UPI003F8AE5FB
MSGEHQLLGRLLLERGLITPEQLEHALALQRKSGGLLGQILVAQGYVNNLQLYEVLAEQLNIPYIGRGLQELAAAADWDLARRFQPEVLLKYFFFPLRREGEKVIVLTSDPRCLHVDRLVGDKTGVAKIEKLLASERDISWLVEQCFKEEILGEAVTGLFYRTPEESAMRVFVPWQVLAGYVIAVAYLYWLTREPIGALAFLVGGLNVFFLASIVFKFVLSLVGAKFEMEGAVTEDEVRALDEKGLPVYTVLVPVFKEPEVVRTLVEGLKRLDYPQDRLDVIFLFEEEDKETLRAAKEARPPANWRFIVVPKSFPQTKPKACNFGLALARGEYLTIYDAEDIPEPDQLKKAVVAFRKYPDKYICFQAALNFYNRDENFLTKMFTLEYSYWFDYLLPGLDRLNLPIPLGGTSNHFRTEKLRELGGWDPFNMTEDADLGIRAYRRGYRVGVLNSTTYEEANSRVRNWIRQRSRWQKGYLQTFLVHNRHPFTFIRKVGFRGWLTLQVFIGGSVATSAVSPFFWLMFIYWLVTRSVAIEPLFPGPLLYISLFNLLVGNFLAIYLNMLAVFKRGYYHLTPYALANPAYWVLHAVAAWKAIGQLFTRPFYWEKTVHGLTREEGLPVGEKVFPGSTAVSADI